MKFRTEINTRRKGNLTHADRILMLGSCFSESIGQRMSSCKLQVDINPFGELYNPLSIARALLFLAQHRRMTDDSLVRTGNLWSSWLHHSRFSSVSPAEALSRMNNRLEQTERNTPDWLFITLGTAWVYEWKQTGEVVANCHKMPDHLFRRRLLSVSEGVETLSDAIRQFREVSPNLSVVLTVSPVRHLRDGAHGNQISKSTLLLICSELCSLPFVDYFPAYELLMDDLRDYRFYADDLVHPSSEAQEYVWQKWCDAFLSDSARQIGQEAEKMLRGMSHRPLSDDLVAYGDFCHALRRRMEAFQALHPDVDFRDECERLDGIVRSCQLKSERNEPVPLRQISSDTACHDADTKE